METPLVAAALIVKNEEKNLPGAIDSLKRYGTLISGIYLYDTGSTDRTVEIARAAGCIVEEGYWDDDFARARNDAAAMANAKWILTLDADERLVIDDLPLFTRQLRDGLTVRMVGVDAMKIAVTDIREGAEIQAHNRALLYRPSRCRWEGRVHEHLVPVRAGGTLASFEPGRAVARVDHYGYGDAEKMPERFSRNLRLAEALVKDLEASATRNDIEYVQALVDRGRSRQMMGDSAGALADLETAWSIPIRSTYRAFGGELLAELLTKRGRLDEASGVIAQLRLEGVSQPSYCDWLAASLATARGDGKLALELLRGIDVLASSLGLVVKPYLVLRDHMWAAIAEGEHLEAAASLVSLMAGQGVIERKFGDLLLTLTRDLPPEGVVELLLEHDRGHAEEIAAELECSGEAGAAMAAALRRRAATREAHQRSEASTAGV